MEKSMSEVATFVNNVSQFEPGESTGTCVAFSAAQVIRMVAPNQVNTSTPEDIDELADTIYINVTGQLIDPIPISVDQLKQILDGYGVRFKEIGTDVGSIDAALNAGYPVIVMGTESRFRYMNGASPYRWDTTGINHCIVVSGIYNVNGYYVHDSANSSPNTVVYSKSMDLFCAIEVFPAWIGVNMVPSGWTDDPGNRILTAPNGRKVPGAWRDYILTHVWADNDVPLEDGYEVDPVEDYYPQTPSGGARMLFNFTELGWTPARGAYKIGIGNELRGCRQERDQLRERVRNLHG
jgi:Peptidase_C39 like family